jgi:hypothetical protein
MVPSSSEDMLARVYTQPIYLEMGYLQTSLYKYETLSWRSRSPTFDKSASGLVPLYKSKKPEKFQPGI